MIRKSVTISSEPINLSILDFKYKIEAEIVVDEYAINLSILDFKCYCEERIFT